MTVTPTTPDLFASVADRPLRIAGYDLETRARDTSSGFTRKTTTVTLSGGGNHAGTGEDVTYESAEHDRLLETADFDLAGTYTVASFSEALDSVDLFPAGPPDEERFRHYRRWAFESAALDLALRQAGLTLAEALGRSYDPVLYRTLLSAFPEAVIEDPGVNDETRSILAEVSDRLSWDLPIEGLGDLDALPWEPRWINVKPSRFGTVASLFETIAYCLENDVRMYGGGQFELGVGRGQIQALASLFYPGGPNDVAPGAYNDPELPDALPASPLTPPDGVAGFRW